MDGLNIATKTGEGAAQILNWGTFHNDLNRMYQEDFARQKYSENLYARSSMNLQLNGSKIRPIDTPLFMEKTNDWKKAQMMLMQKDVQRNPEKRAYFQQLADDNYLEAMGIATQSKNMMQFQHQLNTEYAQKGGRGFTRNYGNYMNAFDNMNIQQIDQSGLNTPFAWMSPQMRVPSDKDWKNILGQQEIKQGKKTFDEKSGKDITEQYKAYAKPAHDVASDMLNAYSADESLQEYYHTILEKNPEEAAKKIQQADEMHPEANLTTVTPEHLAVADALIKRAQTEQMKPIETRNVEFDKKQKIFNQNLRTQAALKVYNVKKAGKDAGKSDAESEAIANHVQGMITKGVPKKVGDKDMIQLSATLPLLRNYSFKQMTPLGQEMASNADGIVFDPKDEKYYAYKYNVKKDPTSKELSLDKTSISEMKEINPTDLALTVAKTEGIGTKDRKSLFNKMGKVKDAVKGGKETNPEIKASNTTINLFKQP
jgi:hypothetical protein